MTSWRDLGPRIKMLERRGLVVKSAYRGRGLPKYLQPALEECGVYVIHAKGLAADDTLCVVRLDWLEQLLNERETAIIRAKGHSQGQV